MKNLDPRPAEPSVGRLRPRSARVRWLTGLGAGVALCACSAMDASEDAAVSGVYVGYPPTLTPSIIDEEPPVREGDRYAAVGTNPFVMVKHDPVSTFATDADTASYDLFVRFANEGGVPEPESVRLEDYEPLT